MWKPSNPTFKQRLISFETGVCCCQSNIVNHFHNDVGASLFFNISFLSDLLRKSKTPADTCEEIQVESAEPVQNVRYINSRRESDFECFFIMSPFYPDLNKVEGSLYCLI